MDKYITVIELPEFMAFARKYLSEQERVEIIDYIANHPEAGDLIQGTGGLRKFRWSANNKGKSGGYRIIHYYHNDNIPVFLVTAFAKNKMENISKEARNEYQKLLPLIIKAYQGDK